MEEKENTYQNLLNIVSAANSEDATSLYNNISKEMAGRIHQELETKKVEIAADMVTKGQLTEYGMEGYGDINQYIILILF